MGALVKKEVLSKPQFISPGKEIGRRVIIRPYSQNTFVEKMQKRIFKRLSKVTLVTSVEVPPITQPDVPKTTKQKKKLQSNCSFFQFPYLSSVYFTLHLKNELHGNAHGVHIAVGAAPAQHGKMLLQEHEKADDKEELEQRTQK